MSLETVMLSPTPCKSLRSLPTSPYTPSELDAQELCATRPFWYDADEATLDLLNVLSNKNTIPDWMPAFRARSLSAASTCAMSPSSPVLTDIISCPGSPEPPIVALPDLDDESMSPVQAEKPECPPGALDKSSWLQARKVFVGGIPQSIDQNALYQMFSKVGKVKKAWLQMFHKDRAASETPTSKKHRGFGFVIFYEKQSIDQLLGDESSRFVNLGNDIRLEVKRSFGKASAQSADEVPSTHKSKKPQVVPASPVVQTPTHKSKKPQVVPASPVVQTQQSSSCTQLSASPASSVQLTTYCGRTGSEESCESGSWMSSSVPPTPQTCRNGSWAALQTPQGLCGPTALVIAFPYIPPFPGSQIVQQPLGHSSTQTQGVSLIETSASEPSMAQQSPYPFVHSGFFHGQMPLDRQELTRALLEAMPDHYED